MQGWKHLGNGWYSKTEAVKPSKPVQIVANASEQREVTQEEFYRTLAAEREDRIVALVALCEGLANELETALEDARLDAYVAEAEVRPYRARLAALKGEG